jgi:hypothetical protein
MRRRAACTVVLGLACIAGVAPSHAQDDTVVRTAPAAVTETALASVLDDLPFPRRPTARRGLYGDPYQLLTSDRLLGLLEELTSIRPHRGWRHSTTSGEAEALDRSRPVRRSRLLSAVGLAQRHGFRTFTGVDSRETTVTLRRDGVDFTAPADSAPGHRDSIQHALRFDSDGVLNDRNPDPQVILGAPLIVRTASQLYGLTQAQAAGRWCC